jgi:hypothetical protein
MSCDSERCPPCLGHVTRVNVKPRSEQFTLCDAWVIPTAAAFRHEVASLTFSGRTRRTSILAGQILPYLAGSGPAHPRTVRKSAAAR